MKVPVWFLGEVEFIDAEAISVDDMLGEDAVKAWAEFLFINAPGWVIDMVFCPESECDEQAKRLRCLLSELVRA